jgi:hypothetical protein
MSTLAADDLSSARRAHPRPEAALALALDSADTMGVMHGSVGPVSLTARSNQPPAGHELCSIADSATGVKGPARASQIRVGHQFESQGGAGILPYASRLAGVMTTALGGHVFTRLAHSCLSADSNEVHCLNGCLSPSGTAARGRGPPPLAGARGSFVEARAATVFLNPL